MGSPTLPWCSYRPTYCCCCPWWWWGKLIRQTTTGLRRLSVSLLLLSFPTLPVHLVPLVGMAPVTQLQSVRLRVVAVVDPVPVVLVFAVFLRNLVEVAAYQRTTPTSPVLHSTKEVPVASLFASATLMFASCDTDSFGVTVPGGKSPPQICGTNTGQHMYIPASDQCNVLNANIGSSSTATTSAFTIKVTQIECSSKTKAPNGCLQYFTEDTGTIETFNYNSAAGVLLVNQDYSSCVRTGRTYCAICYYSTIFKLSVP